VWLKPFSEGFYNLRTIHPSIIPASLFANDMGGTPLAMEVMKNSEISSA
jgi:ethanolamine transporter EutH